MPENNSYKSNLKLSSLFLKAVFTFTLWIFISFNYLLNNRLAIFLFFLSTFPLIIDSCVYVCVFACISSINLIRFNKANAVHDVYLQRILSSNIFPSNYSPVFVDLFARKHWKAVKPIMRSLARAAEEFWRKRTPMRYENATKYHFCTRKSCCYFPFHSF